MWTRKELKARAKAAFKANYWKCVLVALILVLMSSASGNGPRSNVRQTEEIDELSADQQQVMEMMSDLGLNDGRLKYLVLVGMQHFSPRHGSKLAFSLGGLGILGLALSILLVFNPLIVGCYRFFLQNSRGDGNLKHLGVGFQDGWGNVVLVMFLKNLFLMLWGLLFIIPGIVKIYSYRMVPYILKEHPELSGTQAITLSRKMMNGHKWNAFVLDLSFLGWLILSSFTFYILYVFYVSPYYFATDAELYKAIYTEYMNRMIVQDS